jgi:hypothetical protein
MTMFMNFRMLTLGTIAVALLVVGSPAFAAKEAEEVTSDGKVISITDHKLVMTNKENQERSCSLTADAKLTLDGKVCAAIDLTPGTRIRVTTQGGDKSLANQIEGLNKNLDFASNRHDGKVVSITVNKLVMTDMQGAKEQTCTLADDVKITCDGNICTVTALKTGMRIRVTSKSDDPHVATAIEALDKTLKFASI